uniref:GNAT family N-acetyltransferase n=1 Tax=Cumulibacter manganitolerans TaxID=1884992 RepID=UPI0018864EE5
MIDARWVEALTREETTELRELVAEAAAYDAEAGFSRIDPDDVGRGAGPADRVAHLVVRALRDDEPRDASPTTMAAYGRLVATQEGAAVLQLVVRPEFRSRGVATMLLERAGARVGDEGWGPVGARHVRWTAYGDHPAAERLALRFGLDELDRTWKLLRHLRGPFAADLPPLGLAVGEVLLAVVDPAEERSALEDVTTAAGRPRAELDRLVREGSRRVVAARDG